MSRLTVLLAVSSCTGVCTNDFWKGEYSHRVRKADLRISIKDYQRNKNLEILLFRPPFRCRQFLVRMNGVPWQAVVDSVGVDS